MRVIKKEREQTAFEKRNTAITTFVLVALVPLLLCLFLGFSMGKASDVNAENLNQELQELIEEKEELENRINLLTNVFHNADTLYKGFKKFEVTRLTRNLGQAKDEVGFNKWKNDLDISKNNFESKLTNITRPWNSNNEQMNETLEYGKDWLRAFITAKSEELFAVKELRKKEVGIEIESDLRDQIQSLRDELTQKNAELTVLKGDLNRSQASSSDTKEDKVAIQGQLDKFKEKNARIKQDILKEIKEIQKNMNTFMAGGILKENKKKIENFKKDLDINLGTIKDNANDLD